MDRIRLRSAAATVLSILITVALIMLISEYLSFYFNVPIVDRFGLMLVLFVMTSLGFFTIWLLNFKPRQHP